MPAFEIGKAVLRLEEMNENLRSDVKFFQSSQAMFAVDGAPTKLAMIEEWQRLIDSNEKMIANYRAALAKLNSEGSTAPDRIYRQ